MLSTTTRKTTMTLRDKPKQEKTEYEKIIEEQLRLGIGMTSTRRSNVTKVEEVFKVIEEAKKDQTPITRSGLTQKIKEAKEPKFKGTKKERQ